jgi:hypothetical protein
VSELEANVRNEVTKKVAGYDDVAGNKVTNIS